MPRNKSLPPLGKLPTLDKSNLAAKREEPRSPATMAQNIKMDFARLLKDKQDEHDDALAAWAQSARSIMRMLSDAVVDFDQFDFAAFDAAVEDLRRQTGVVRPLIDEVNELRNRLK